MSIHARDLRVITVSGAGYQRGWEHGSQLREPIHRLVMAVKQAVQEKYGRSPDEFISAFLHRFDFLSAARRWTPELVSEVRGIADGSGSSFDDIFILQFVNDELFMNGGAVAANRCSALGMRGPAASLIAQNMDLRGWLEGFQVVLRERDTSGFETVVLTHTGLIALAGVNQSGVGVVVNALTQLRHSGDGLPVAFVIRGLLEQRSYSGAVDFLRRVSHATGQNYIVGAPEAIGSFEAGADGVAEYLPRHKWPVLYHTNHPLAATKFISGYQPENADFDSLERMRSLAARLDARPSGDLVELAKSALRAKDSPRNPVCRPLEGPTKSFTFGSVIFELSAHPVAWVTAGPPDRSEYRKFELSPAPSGANGERVHASP